jgi:hypothetical protein
MQIRNAFKKSSFLLIVLAGFLIGVSAYAGVEKIMPNENKIEAKHFPKNESGETYGSDMDVAFNEQSPDLILAMGDDGKIGYVRDKELNMEAPKSIKEALAQNNDKYRNRVINLYDKEGKTIIDKLTLGCLKPEKEDIIQIKENIKNQPK